MSVSSELFNLLIVLVTHFGLFFILTYPQNHIGHVATCIKVSRPSDWKVDLRKLKGH